MLWNMFIILLLVFIATVTGITIMRENWLFFLFGLQKKDDTISRLRLQDYKVSLFLTRCETLLWVFLLIKPSIKTCFKSFKDKLTKHESEIQITRLPNKAPCTQLFPLQPFHHLSLLQTYQAGTDLLRAGRRATLQPWVSSLSSQTMPVHTWHARAQRAGEILPSPTTSSRWPCSLALII